MSLPIYQVNRVNADGVASGLVSIGGDERLDSHPNSGINVIQIHIQARLTDRHLEHTVLGYVKVDEAFLPSHTNVICRI